MSHVDSLDRFAAAIIDPALPPPKDLGARGAATDPLRFAVYRNNVHVGLVGVLEARFPVTRRIVGDRFFRQIARTFVGEHKPATPLLFTYGDDFPAFIATLPEAAAVPYIVDVARLEVLWSQAYNAAEAAPMTISDLATIPPDQIGGCRARFHPSAGWLHSPYPVATIWARHQEASIAPFELGDGESVLVVRPDAEVILHKLEAGAAAFVDHLITGSTLATAAQSAAPHPDFEFGTALVGLVSAGVLVALSPCLEDQT